MRDIADGIADWRLWAHLSWSDIRRRYRGTVLGPFWTTLTMAIFVIAVGLVFSALWQSRPVDYMPYFTAGLLAWWLISQLVLEGGQTLLANEPIFTQRPLPFTLFACVTVARNLIVFAHHLLFYVCIVLYFGIPVGAATLLVVPALVLIALNGLWVALLFGLLVVRFRDVQPLLQSAMQILFFVTPILWQPSQAGRAGKLIATWNPAYHFIQLVRAPLVGEVATGLNWGAAAAITLAGLGGTFLVFRRCRHRIVYWL